MQIIGFTGGMGVGKSTAIETLHASGAMMETIKFAGPLYDMQEFIYRRIAPVYTRDSQFVKDRTLLQWLGTEWGRGLSNTLWVSLWKREVERLRDAHTDYPMVIVCDDCRFDNEAEAIRSLGGVVVHIQRDRPTADAPNGIEGHKSEAGISSHLIDHVVTNNGTVEEFEASLRGLFEQLGVGRTEPAEAVL